MSTESRDIYSPSDIHSGSTATIIRLPYTVTLKPYKGDFLYRTTDFAIWTTVEVGIGISAGCIATLKPLLKTSFLTTRSGNRSTGNPWSKDPASKLGSKMGRQTPMGLHELKPMAGKSITTTVTAGRHSNDSDEEKFLGQFDRVLPGPDGGIHVNKSVTTTVVEERGGYYPTRQAPHRGQPSTPTMERRRNGSPGGDSASTLEYEDRSKPVRAFGAF